MSSNLFTEIQESADIICIVGPTASGKTQFAMELAQEYNGEIVSCDAMQVYRELNIISAKPPASDQQKVKHHMLNVCSVASEYDVHQYNRAAMISIKEILSQSRRPIIVGGSGMYVMALIDGLFDSQPADLDFRSSLELDSNEELVDKLLSCDPKAAQRIHAHDRKRLIRALEVFHTMGKPISELQPQREGLWSQHKIQMVGLTMDRTQLYDRINKRVDVMFADGAVDEIAACSMFSKTSGELIGVKEVRQVLNKELSIEDAKLHIAQRSRNYAKRQLTWFRRDQRIQWKEV